MSDFIGKRGESLAHSALTKILRKNNTPFFEAYLIDSKARTLDYYVELVGAGKKRPYFFAQVKSTRAGYTFPDDPNRKRLRVQATKNDMVLLSLIPAPTYLLGIDEVSERSYIISIRKRPKKNISSITTKYELTPEILRKLWEEVKTYWTGRNMRQLKSAFED